MQKLVHNGVALAYADVGIGSPTLLFVHGWACDHTFFAPQVEHFSRTHRIIAVDLRGHGESDKPLQDYTMEGFADDLAWLCAQLGVENPVVVGHSMGGLVALIFAARHATIPAAVVLLDMPTALILGPLPAGNYRHQMIDGLHASRYREVARELGEAMFLPSDDRDRQARTLNGMLATPQHVLASSFKEGWECDLANAASTCKAPILFVQASGDRPELERFKLLCPQLILGRTIGSGHFHQLEVPDQINAMIDRFLAVTMQATLIPLGAHRLARPPTRHPS